MSYMAYRGNDLVCWPSEGLNRSTCFELLSRDSSRADYVLVEVTTCEAELTRSGRGIGLRIDLIGRALKTADPGETSAWHIDTVFLPWGITYSRCYQHFDRH